MSCQKTARETGHEFCECMKGGAHPVEHCLKIAEDFENNNLNNPAALEEFRNGMSGCNTNSINFTQS
jgi:hypothetical protein